MNCFSTLACTVAISAYLLDVLPKHAALSAAWLNAFRTIGKPASFQISAIVTISLIPIIGGFCVTYFQIQWVHRSGAAVTFGSQAGITAFFIISIILVQVFGVQWRKRFPAPKTSRTY
jgi:hypothetical protein